MATLQFKVRLDEALHAAIKRAADENSRSVNAEIVHRLQQTIDEETDGIPTKPLKIIGGLGAGERDYLLEVERLGAKLDQILKKLEEK